MSSGLDDALRVVDDTVLDRRVNPMSGEAVISFGRDLVPAVIELFVIVDPLGNLPIFVALTKDIGSGERMHTYRTAVLTGFILLTVFALAGMQVFSWFGITLDQFMIAGGILLLVMSVKILVAGGWSVPVTGSSNVAAFPMAVPLLVGPGAITATILSLETRGIYLTFCSVLTVFLLVAVILSVGEPIHRILGEAGATVISGVMMIISAAIAVGFITRGIRNLI